ncbi:MAG: DUF11 domain-containing protein [Bifidobacteriaceae bacterium]|jgi:uncharacterized repeat protein (TIGR01451 family)|nr:DUF11 domain-containing protein [Bifidobacteriaceae bacterium]
MFQSKLIAHLAALAAAVVTAAGLIVALPAGPANAAPTHHRPGIEGVNKLLNWRHGTVSVHLDDKWQIYAKAGEMIHASVEDLWTNWGGSPNPSLQQTVKPPQLRVRILGPSGAVIGNCLADGYLSNCQATATASSDGVYQAVWDSPSLLEDGPQLYFRQDTWVTKGTADLIGRVFTTRYRAEQSSHWHTLHPDQFGVGGVVDEVVNYVVGDDGTLFEVSVRQINGISSTFHADSVGLAEAATCLPTNASAGWNGAFAGPKYITQALEDQGCGRPFLIFPDRPAADLPASLTAGEGWDGPIYPRYQAPTAPQIIRLEPVEPPDPARPLAAEVTFELGAFKGSYQVGADVNGDGDLDDALDVSEMMEKTSPDNQPVAWKWDGRDAQGNAVMGQAANPIIVVQLLRANRYSLMLADVEVLAGGARIEQLAGYDVVRNGGQPVTPKVHWDDTDVAATRAPGTDPAMTLTTEPKLIKTPDDGLIQSGFVHGWDQSRLPEGTYSWGDCSEISFNLWNDLAGDTNLRAAKGIAQRQLVIESKTGALQPAKDGARRIEYTVKVKNTGAADFTATQPGAIIDTLPLHVSAWRIESLAYGSGTDPAAGRAVLADGQLSWKGPLKAGETATLRYSGRVEPGFSASRVNTVNTAECPAVSRQEIVTVSICSKEPVRAEVKLPGLLVDKTVDRASVQPGQVVHYTVGLKNIGQAAFTTSDPARVVDDLSGVLDDSVLDTSSISPPDAVWDPASATISWAGPLAVGARQEIKYAVTYRPAKADLVLNNTAQIYPEDVIDLTPGTKAKTSTPGSDLHLSKQADKDVVNRGQAVGYTILLDNSRGQAPANVNWYDDLTGVLDDAALTKPPVVSGSGVTATVDGSRIVLRGAVAPGAKVAITYSVTVAAAKTATADAILRNSLIGECADGPCPPPSQCHQDDPLTTCTPVMSYNVTKEAVVAGDRRYVKPGEAVTYRLTFTNTGGIEADVNTTDDLSGVLDDADVDGLDLSQAEAINAELSSTGLVVTGKLAVGGVAVVSYQAWVRPAGERGDSVLVNRVADTVTETPVSELYLVKTADPSRAKTGDLVNYRIDLKATGAVAVSFDLTDYLGDVLDDGTVVTPPVSDIPAVTASYEAGSAFISLKGQLEPEAHAIITYQVKVRPDDQVGDRVMTNVVLERPIAGLDGPVECIVFPAGHCTSTPVDVVIDPGDPPSLPVTGVAGMIARGAGGIALVVGGLGLMVWARRRVRASRLA